LDYESQTSYELTITATDGTNTVSKIFKVYSLMQTEVKNIDTKQSNKGNNQNSKSKGQDNHMK